MRRLILLALLVPASASAGLFDETPPQLLSLVLHTTAIDTTNGPAQVVVSGTAADDLSGVLEVAVGISTVAYGPSGPGEQDIDCIVANVGALQSAFTCTATIPQLAPLGAWVIDGVWVRDLIYNLVGHRAAALRTAGYAIDFVNGPVAPEPGTALLLIGGLAMLARSRRPAQAPQREQAREQ